MGVGFNPVPVDEAGPVGPDEPRRKNPLQNVERFVQKELAASAQMRLDEIPGGLEVSDLRHRDQYILPALADDQRADRGIGFGRTPAEATVEGLPQTLHRERLGDEVENAVLEGAEGLVGMCGNDDRGKGPGNGLLEKGETAPAARCPRRWEVRPRLSGCA